MCQGLEFFRALWSNLTFSFGNKFYENCFPHVEMDKGAIWEASETDLNQLGLTDRGDIIRFKEPQKKLQRKRSDIRVGSLS